MKKMLIILGLSLLVCSLVAEDFMQPAQVAKDSYYSGMRFGMRSVSRDQDPAPDYFFIPNGDGENTTYLTSSYYDYMPFSYNGHNLRKQPAISQPYGYDAGGWYVTYMRSETDAIGTDRRAYYSYINADGTLGESSGINSVINREGFTTCAVDPYTGDPFVSWHSVTEPDGSYDSHMSYALYHATSTPGSWRTPFIMFDNPEESTPYTGATNDEFIWPQIWIGPSPEAGHRRVHAYGNNYTSNTAGGANYNSLYKYADFDDMDLLTSSDLDWTAKSFPFFDDMHYNNVDRVNKDMIVSEVDGKVVFFGSIGDSLLAMYSDNYGETFTKYTEDIKQPLVNPTYENLPNTYLWEDDDGSPSEMFIVPSNDLSHNNGAFTEDNAKIVWMGGMNYNSQENMDAALYMAAYQYPKIFSFDTATLEFDFYDLDIQGVDPADDVMAIAFDLDEDGEVDEYYPDSDPPGKPVVQMSCPSWFFNTDQGWQDAYFHESNCKMASNENWVVLVWHDGAKVQGAYWAEEGYDGWYKQPEIAISISDDSGETWSDILYINANPLDNVVDPDNHYDDNYAPEFEDMLPVSISLGDKLEILSNEPGNYHAKLSFVFTDDGDYGSWAGQTGGGGDPTNSALRYAAIDLEFQEANEGGGSSSDITLTPDAELLGQNYPNPFNPTTTITYNMVEEGNVSIEVFNIRGQLVKTLINDQVIAGDHTLVWEGTNDNNQKVSSGIYFYKMKSGNYSSTKKMILMK